MTTEAESIKLGDGTQTLRMRDATIAICRCGASLTWATKLVGRNSNEQVYADCPCSMSYVAWEAMVKIEGIDRSAL